MYESSIKMLIKIITLQIKRTSYKKDSEIMETKDTKILNSNTLNIIYMASYSPGLVPIIKFFLVKNLK